MKDRLFTVAQMYDQPPLMPLWPDFGRGVCQLAESTTFQLAAEGRLPVETVRLGRKRYVRTIDVLTWLHLPTNDDSAGYQPAPPVEQSATTSSSK
ncbi:MULTISPECIES: DNA-binding protein [Streptomyces]|uniref:DNA-binding protein n=1 Tax=Streptomyces dengpaensis TaxID=2049881 RepID=A0ABM6ST86_9ACTN|nr:MULTISPECIES: DNA-binding protein [Streptomyces]AVH57861.1 DNA-binding protein [Streptomyces dengpaensis]PIB04842.1 hypothetical protein B1C81_31340 [Streptomyces sp. HG99]